MTSSSSMSSSSPMSFYIGDTEVFTISNTKVEIVQPIEIPVITAESIPNPKTGCMYLHIDEHGNLATKARNKTSCNMAQEYILRDEKSTGTNGGSASNGAWFTRTLNTLVTMPLSTANITLSSNEFTLQPGRYSINASSPAHRCSNFQCRMFDVTNNDVAVHGTSASAPTGLSAFQTASVINHVWSISEQTTYRIEMRVSNSRNLDGCGIAVGYGGGTEVYTMCKIIRFGNH